MPDPDAAFAEVLRGQPVVVGTAGVESARRSGAPDAPLRRAPVRLIGEDPARFVRRFASTIRSLDLIDSAAAGHGLLSVDPEAGIVRRVPLLAAVGALNDQDPALLPTLALEVLRVAGKSPGFIVRADRHGVETVSVAGRAIPTDPDGRAWIHFSPSDDRRFVSAADVLAGRVERERLEGHVVLLGTRAVALGDFQATPVAAPQLDERGKPLRDDRMPGVEIHAQLIENILDDAPLRRPRWARWAEVGMLAVAGSVLVGVLPIFQIRTAMPLAVVLVAATAALGFPLYRYRLLLFDSALPATGLVVVLTGMLAVALAAADGHRRQLRRELQQERETAARITGELEAARRMQMGILPDLGVVLANESRLDVYALVEPAREVGGDLYDMFRLDDDRVCIVVGDVTGKGVQASLFMAVSKALCKSAGLRNPSDPGALLGNANAEISRDNPEALFVTMWTGVLDLRTGHVSHANAGHDAPYLLPAGGGPPMQFGQASGPPLCFIDDFDYDATSNTLRPGDALCVVTDGVTEAHNAKEQLYGRERLEAVLTDLGTARTAAAVGDAVRRDVAKFTAGAPPADDLTILVLKWKGPG
jgi:serine phosphatase RsbU (regulator of sigma subunit)